MLCNLNFLFGWEYIFLQKKMLVTLPLELWNEIFKFNEDDKPPLYNYARFCTRLDFFEQNFNRLTTSGSNILINRLTNCILDHSTVIKELITDNINRSLINSYHRFDNSFQNLNELDCTFTCSIENLLIN